MIPQISSALSKGFNSKQIIDYILKKFPEHSGRIKDAMAAGFTVDQVLKFISGGKKALSKIDQDQAPTEFQQTRNRDISRKENVDKRFLQGAALAATPIASRAAASALSRALPQSVQKIMPEILPSIVPSMTGQDKQPDQQAQGLPQVTSNQTLPQQPPINSELGNISEQKEINQPKENSDIVSKLWSNFEKGRDKGFDFESDAFLRVAKRMKSTGEINSKEDFEKFFNLFDAKKNEGKDLPTALKEASLEYDNQKLSPGKENLAENEQIPQEQEKISPKIEKSETVSSPHGIGEVREIRNGQAIIDVDGKKHKVSVDELEQPSFSDEEVANAYDDLMAKIPEEHRSGFISWAGYDEDRNVLGFIPRGGKYEELSDITPEEAKMIKEGKGVARTTGANREGLWVSGEDTRGGVISQVIHDRKKKNKSNEDKQGKFDLNLPKPEKPDRGMKPLFDELSYARGLSRERERKKKEQAKEKLKREKDEAKKRKK